MFPCLDRKEKIRQVTGLVRLYGFCMFLSKCNLGVREGRILKNHNSCHFNRVSLADLRSVVMYLQWSILEEKCREKILEQRMQHRAFSSSFLSSQGLEDVFRSTQNKRTTIHKAHFFHCGTTAVFHPNVLIPSRQ